MANSFPTQPADPVSRTWLNVTDPSGYNCRRNHLFAIGPSGEKQVTPTGSSKYAKSSLPIRIWIQAVVTPENTRLIAALLQSSIGALSALIAVLLTQYHSRRTRREQLYERLFDMRFAAYAELYQELITLRQKILTGADCEKARLRLIDSTMRSALFFDDELFRILQSVLTCVAANEDREQIDLEIRKALSSVRNQSGIENLKSTMSK